MARGARDSRGSRGGRTALAVGGVLVPLLGNTLAVCIWLPLLKVKE